MEVNVIEEFKSRGYFFQCTDEEALNKLLTNKKVKFYIGFDCTAPSLHVGSLMQIMCLRFLQKLGHTPIVLLGGGTTMVGDPSGKEESRKLLEEKDIKKNIQNIKKVFLKFLSKSGKNKVIFVDNKTWLGKLNYINFLRDYGKHFTINKMLTFDSVKTRLEREQSLSFLEFNYMIFQSYDFLKLFKKYDCLLQIGGSDQWGNIVNGVELIRKITGKSCYGLTTPLITTSSGQKMGKTEKGAVWLDKKMLSPFEYWQFWRNSNDQDVIKYLKLFTELSIDEIKKLEETLGSKINELKILLATETTRLLHGDLDAEIAKKIAKKTFTNKSFSEELPTTLLDIEKLEKGVLLRDILIQIKFANSNSDFRRNLLNFSYRIENEIIKEENKMIYLNDFKNSFLKISFGKKRHHLLKIK